MKTAQKLGLIVKYIPQFVSVESFISVNLSQKYTKKQTNQKKLYL